VFRLLAHPRFRAAFDFLELRLSASDSHAEDVAFWREAQTQSGEELSAALGVAPPREFDVEESGAVAPKRRRRRRRPGGDAPAAE
jgi:poly(A) polymerase